MSMHPIDAAILDGTLTATLCTEQAALPLPAAGHSYWGDAMRECAMDPVAAARRAARYMGTALTSIQAARA